MGVPYSSGEQCLYIDVFFHWNKCKEGISYLFLQNVAVISARPQFVGHQSGAILENFQIGAEFLTERRRFRFENLHEVPDTDWCILAIVISLVLSFTAESGHVRKAEQERISE